MLQHPKNGNKLFLVAVYNKDVRSLVEENQSHNFFDDFWADVQNHDICAKDEEEARTLLADRFPPAQGFVIKEIVPA